MNIFGLGFGWQPLPFGQRKWRPSGSGNSHSESSEVDPSSSSSSVRHVGGPRGLSRFPLIPAATSASLALAGDTIAQIVEQSKVTKSSTPRKLEGRSDENFKLAFIYGHDWLRALRMASYGFLLYGPGSYAWYQLLDHFMPTQTLQNLATKVILNQIILGPCVIAVVFAWNSLWLGKVSELPVKYQKDAFPTLLNGFKFWIPASMLNFGVVPLQARVAFMSACSIFWNFYLSTTMSKK